MAFSECVANFIKLSSCSSLQCGGLNEGFYKCFSSGEFGDIFTFIMKTEGLSFPEAVEKLALEAGLEVFKNTQEDNRILNHRKLLYNALECATTFFQNELFGFDNSIMVFGDAKDMLQQLLKDLKDL